MRELDPEGIETESVTRTNASAGPDVGLRLLKKRRFEAIGQILLSIFEGFCEAAILTLFARIALGAVSASEREVYVPALGTQSLDIGLVILVGLVLVRLVAGLLNVLLGNRLQFRFLQSVRDEVIDVFSGSSWERQMKFDDGKLHHLIVTLPGGISNQLSGLITYFGHFVMMAAMIGYAFFTDSQLTLMLIGVVVFASVIFGPIRKGIRKQSAKNLLDQKDLALRTSELSRLRLETQVFGASAAIARSLKAVVAKECERQAKVSLLRGTVPPIYTSLIYGAVTVSLLILGSSEPDGLESTGPILLVVLRSLSYGTAIQQAATAVAALRPSLELLNRSVFDLRRGRHPRGTVAFDRLAQIEMADVTYTYRSSNEAALQDVSLSISGGQKVGVVGPSGGGKSTLLRLVLGLIEPDEGRVWVNGRRLVDYDLHTWTRHVGVVPQFPSTFSGTVSDNLRFFREGIGEDDLWKALEIADLAEEVRAWPSGLSTLLGGDGWVMSGGQQQRLAIARAFAGNPQLVIMDEPTSSVDSLSESTVAETIDRIPRSMTLLIASHRMRILRGCDQIVVVENAEVTATGSLDEVLERSEYMQSLSRQGGLELE